MSLEDSNSDMDMDLLEESEDELNMTTYFHDDIEDSTDDSDNSNDNIGDVVNKQALEVIEEESGDDHTDLPMDIVAGSSEREVIDRRERMRSEDDHREMSMVLSPTETKNQSMTLCPVCYEITIVCKDSTLYNNLILACMQQRSKN